MELVRMHRPCRRRRPRRVAGRLQHDVAASARPAVHHDVGGYRAHHFTDLPVPANPAREVHQPPALRVDRRAAGDSTAQRGPHRRVRLQRVHRALGESAADEDAVGLGRRGVRESVERDQPRSGRLQRFEVAGVVEAERGVARDGDAHVGDAARRAPAARGCAGVVERFGSGCDREHPVQVDILGDASRDALHPLVRLVGLGRRHEAQMCGAQLEIGGTPDRSQHGDVRIGAHRAHELRHVAIAADLVQDDPGDSHLGVECAVAVEQRRDPARDAPRVHDEHHRRREQLRQCGVAVRAIERHTVVEPLVALDEGEVRAFAVPRELASNLGPPHRVEVEIAAASAGRRGEPHRIDVVRALLERLHDELAPAQGRRDSGRNRGLPRRLVRRGDEQARRGVHDSVRTRRVGRAVPRAVMGSHHRIGKTGPAGF